jgi:3,4-dihydroxy-2-butanone 4-phosphate synthase
MTTPANPWNEVYKLAAGRRKTSTQITTLRKPDGSLTADTKKTLQLMLDNVTPKDNEHDNNDYYKQVRAQTQQPADTTDDREFTIEEIRSAVENMDNKKAPGEDGVTPDILKRELVPPFLIGIPHCSV